MNLEELRNFGLTEQQIMVREMARDFADKEIVPYIDACEREGCYPREIIAKLGPLGFLGCLIPEKYGGPGLDYVSYGVVCEEIARGDWLSASVISVQNSLVATSILNFGSSEALKKRYLEPMARGEMISSAALTEPNSGSDLASLATTATPTPGGYVLNGGKMFISHASHADVFFVLATLDRSLRHKGICAFIVERDSPGITCKPIPMHCLRRGNTAEVTFEDVLVPEENLLGKQGEGFKVVAAALDRGRFSVASRAVGHAQACVDVSLKYATERSQFGQVIGSFQMVQQMLADMISQTEAARLIVRRVGQLKDAGVERASFEASMGKLVAGDNCVKVATDAVQVFGGYGLAEEFPVGRYFQEAKVFQIIEGTNQLQRVLVAEYALGLRKY
ncbi:MAG: acyl-CoA dehydrogenase family protein [Chloroflexi bacterium]|nr:acyl-CoA dehydrogenase family protein [Chloroflexota bacterium]